MIASGRGKLLVALAAVLGIALGNVGCQGTTAPGVAYGDLTGDLGPSVARTGGNGNHSDIVQASYNAPGTPGDHDATGYLPAGPQSPPKVASAQTLPEPVRMPSAPGTPESARPPFPAPESCG